MVGAEYPQAVSEQVFEGGGGAGGITGLPPPVGEIVTSAESIGIVGAEVLFGGVVEALEVRGGRGDLTGLAEA